MSHFLLGVACESIMSEHSPNLKMASTEDVCRLCLSNDGLVSVFDKRFNSANDIKKVILITTGVEIYEKDVISQMICKKCCQISIKMFQFRNASQENDRYLKAKYKENLDTSSMDYKIPNTCVTMKTQKKVEPKIKTESIDKPNYKIHPSVAALFTVYPGLKLPTICFKCNIEPTVLLEMNTVEDYMKKQKSQQTYAETNHEKKIAKKCTSAFTKTTGTYSIETPITDPLDISSFFLMKTKTNDKSDISVEEKDQKQSDYAIVSVSGIVNDEQSSSDSQMSGTEKVTMKLKRRRLTDSDFFSDPETKDSSSSEPQPKKKPVGGSDELCLGKSERLFICNICNSVHNRVRELKRHRLKHMRCQFCKLHFKTISAKINHVANLCRIKNMMIVLPTVKLDRIELNQRIRSKYSAAFQDFSSSPALRIEPSTPDDTTKCRVDDNATKRVIEILSGGESTYPPCKNDTSTEFQEEKIVPNVIETTARSELSSTKSTADEVLLVTTPAVVHMKTEENEFQSSVSIVKPDIRIKNNNVLDYFDPKFSDIKLVKELLTRYTLFNFQKEESSQTELPSNQSICVNKNNWSTELKNLKSSLLVYKIPILIKKGTLQINFDYSAIHSQAHSPKKLCLWNDLTPIDVNVGSNINHSWTSAPPNLVTPGTAPSVNSLVTALPNPRVYQNRYKSAINSLSGGSQLASHSATTGTHLPNLVIYPQSTVPNTFNAPIPSFNCRISSNVPAGTSLTYADPRIDPFQPSITSPIVHGLTFRKPIVNIRQNTGPSTNMISNTAIVPDLISKKPVITTEQNAGPVIDLSSETPTIPCLAFSKSGKNMEQYTIPLLDMGSLSTQDTSSAPNVNPFSIPNVPVPRKSPVINQNSTGITSLERPQNVPVIQNNVSISPSHPLTASTSSNSNKTGSVFGTIRVKSVWELK